MLCCSGALDDVAAAWAAVTYDEGLQLVRWSACRWIMLAELEPGKWPEKISGSAWGCW